MTDRRDFIKAGVWTTVFAGLGPAAFAADRGGCKLRFGVVSDIHLIVNGPWGNDQEPPKEAALEALLRWYDAQGVDAVLVTGDIADFGKAAELKRMREIWERVFPGDKGADGRHVERLFISGNHEVLARDYKDEGGYWNDKARDRVWRAAFDEPYEDIRVKTVKGYDFILCGWGHSNGPDGAKKFEETLARCGARNQLFFQAQHQPPYGTCHGNRSNDADNGVAGGLMAKYANCVSFSGHTHEVLGDERTVWQREFTSIGCCSFSCTYRSGSDYPPFGYENGPSGAVQGSSFAPGSSDALNGPKGMSYELGKVSFKARQAMLVSVYDGELEIQRREFNAGEDIGAAWLVPYPAKAGGPFDPKKRPSLFAVPEFPADAALTVKEGTVHLRSGVVGPGWHFAAPGGAKVSGGPVMTYQVGYRRKGKDVHLFYVAALDYNQPPSKRAEKMSFAVSAFRLPKDATEVFVRPLDCFGRAGKPISVKVPEQETDKRTMS